MGWDLVHDFFSIWKSKHPAKWICQFDSINNVRIHHYCDADKTKQHTHEWHEWDFFIYFSEVSMEEMPINYFN